MPNKSSWIILSAEHISETYIPPEGDFRGYVISPNYNLKKDDNVYLWSNVSHGFFGWGEITEPPKTFMQLETENSRPRKRQSVYVNRQKEFYPPITIQMMLGDKNLKKLIPIGFDDLYAIPLRPGQANYLNDFIREHNLDAPQGSESVTWSILDNAPDITVQAIITPENENNEGTLITEISIAWDEIIKVIENDPEEIYKIDPFAFEKLIAEAYVREGYEVILTPRSGDKGRDIIATKQGIGSIRIFDQVKRYAIRRPVTAKDVRELIGVISMESQHTKGIITTTSTFAPGIYKDQNIIKLMPRRLELRPKNVLIPWLQSLRRW